MYSTYKRFILFIFFLRNSIKSVDTATKQNRSISPFFPQPMQLIQFKLCRWLCTHKHTHTQFGQICLILESICDRFYAIDWSTKQMQLDDVLSIYILVASLSHTQLCAIKQKSNQFRSFSLMWFCFFLVYFFLRFCFVHFSSQFDFHSIPFSLSELKKKKKKCARATITNSMIKYIMSCFMVSVWCTQTILSLWKWSVFIFVFAAAVAKWNGNTNIYIFISHGFHLFWPLNNLLWRRAKHKKTI